MIIVVDRPLYRYRHGRYVRIADSYRALDDGLPLPRILYPIMGGWRSSAGSGSSS